MNCSKVGHFAKVFHSNCFEINVNERESKLDLPDRLSYVVQKFVQKIFIELS